MSGWRSTNRWRRERALERGAGFRKGLGGDVRGGGAMGFGRVVRLYGGEQGGSPRGVSQAGASIQFNGQLFSVERHCVGAAMVRDFLRRIIALRRGGARGGVGPGGYFGGVYGGGVATGADDGSGEGDCVLRGEIRLRLRERRSFYLPENSGEHWADFAVRVAAGREGAAVVYQI